MLTAAGIRCRAIGHALAFETWRSLVREQDLSRAEATELMTRLVAVAASDPDQVQWRLRGRAVSAGLP